MTQTKRPLNKLPLSNTLIIIDMQKGMAVAPAEQRNNPLAESNIGLLLHHWRTQQIQNARAPIVHVRHVSRTLGSPFWPGQIGAEFQDAFAPLEREAVFEKNTPDAFANTGLERWLHQRDITHLTIVGVSTNNSVESTTRSAGNLGFVTSVVCDACFAFAKTDYNAVARSAEDVHAMSLSNLQGEYARVVSTQEVLREAY